MSGETELDVSGWTVDTLHSHLLSTITQMDRRYEASLAERDRRYEQRFEAQIEAIKVANQANEKRLDNVNEFRGQLNDMLVTLMPRSECEQRFKSLEEKVSGGQRSGFGTLWGYVAVGIGMAFLLAAFYLMRA